MRPVHPDPIQRIRLAVTSWNVLCSGNRGSHGQPNLRIENRARHQLALEGPMAPLHGQAA